MRWSTQGEHWADEAGACLISECEAFLSGSYAEFLEERGKEVPPWAWLNLGALRRPRRT